MRHFVVRGGINCILALAKLIFPLESLCLAVSFLAQQILSHILVLDCGFLPDLELSIYDVPKGVLVVCLLKRHAQKIELVIIP